MRQVVVRLFTGSRNGCSNEPGSHSAADPCLLPLDVTEPLTPEGLRRSIHQQLKQKFRIGGSLKPDYIHPAAWDDVSRKWELYTPQQPILIPSHGRLSAIVVPDVSMIGTIGGQESVRAKEVIRSSMLCYAVTTNKSSSHKRNYDECRFIPWNNLERVMSAVEELLGDMALEDPRELGKIAANVSGEPQANDMYIIAVCDVVRAIARLRGHDVKCTAFEPGPQRPGNADFTWTDRTTEKRVGAGEGKVPPVFRKLTRVVDSEPSVLRECSVQTADYLRNNKLGHGFLTNQHGTLLLERQPDRPDVYAITDLIPWDSTDVTVIGMMTYIVLQELEHPRDWPDPFTAAQPRQQQEVDMRQQQQLQPAAAAAAGGQGGVGVRVTCSQRRQQQQQRHQQAAEGLVDDSSVAGGSSNGSLDYIYPPQALVLYDEILGFGRVGQVTSGSLYGRPCAVKIVDAGKQGDLVQLIKHEINTLGRLSPLQGSCVPELRGYGYIDYGNSYFMAVSEIKPAMPPSSSMPQRAVDTAVQSLKQIHAAGVLHGDVRADNVLMQEADGQWKAWFIDFGLASEATTEEQCLDEVAQLLAVFRQSLSSEDSDAYWE